MQNAINIAHNQDSGKKNKAVCLLYCVYALPTHIFLITLLERAVSYTPFSASFTMVTVTLPQRCNTLLALYTRVYIKLLAAEREAKPACLHILEKHWRELGLYRREGGRAPGPLTDQILCIFRAAETMVLVQTIKEQEILMTEAQFGCVCHQLTCELAQMGRDEATAASRDRARLLGGFVTEGVYDFGYIMPLTLETALVAMEFGGQYEHILRSWANSLLAQIYSMMVQTHEDNMRRGVHNVYFPRMPKRCSPSAQRHWYTLTWPVEGRAPFGPRLDAAVVALGVKMMPDH